MLLEKYDDIYYRIINYNKEKEKLLLNSHPDIYENIPENFEQYIINGSYYKDSNGDFKIDLNKALDIQKNTLLNILEELTKNYIEKYYNSIKQRSDVNDKEFFTSIIVKKQQIDINSLSKNIYDNVADFFDGIKTFDECVYNLCPKDENGNISMYEYNNVEYPYSIPYSQLLKTAIRQAWVQFCKMTYYKIKENIINTQSFEELSNIIINDSIFPKYPL